MKKKIVLLSTFCLLCLWNAGCSGGQTGQTQKAAATMSTIYNPEILFSSEVIDLTEGRDFFVDYRIQREQFREQSKEMLRVLLESDNQDNKIKAEKRWLVLTDQIAKETEIENMLKMKGYEDAVSKVIDKNVSVMVYAEKISAQNVDKIQKVIGEIAGTSSQNVEISNLYW